MLVVDLLASLVAVLVVVALAVAWLAAMTVAPFVVGVDLAERRGVAGHRAGALCAVAVLGALAAAWVLRDHLWLAVPALGVSWLGPVALSALGPGTALAGGTGAHEH